MKTRLTEIEKRRIAESKRQEELAAKAKQEKEAAVADAVKKLRTEPQPSESNSEEIIARHAEELRALEAKLVAKFDAELKSAKDEASQSVVASSENKAEQEKASSEEHDQAIKAAVERGRMEYMTKLKLKDTMLTKAQNNVKLLEAQIKAWREAGVIPPDAESSGTPATTTTPIKATPSNTAVTPGGQGASAPATAGPSTLPRKPSLSVSTLKSSAAPVNPNPNSNPIPVVNAADAVLQNVRGGARGRGGVRGGPPRGRGGAPVGRGAGQTAAPANTLSPSTTPSGMSIIGAAGKRGREESGTPDSLAKRLKPVETPGNKPVALRRPPPASGPPN